MGGFSKLQRRYFKETLLTCLMASTTFADYSSALRNFNAREYATAAPQFYDALQKSKERTQTLQAALGLGKSLQRLGFHHASVGFFSTLVESGERNSFRQALEAFAEMSETSPLSRSTVVQLYKQDVEIKDVSPNARGFFFYYAGREYFQRQLWRQSEEAFKQVPHSSTLYPKALFHLGIVTHLSTKSPQSERYFEKALEAVSSMRSTNWFREQVFLNLARIYYEKQDYLRAIDLYAKIPRDSENWLTALFESAWAFFLMEKPNNTLGNIHTLRSPFFETRFFPEIYILQATTFLRLCRFDRVRETIDEFDLRYGSVFNQLKEILDASAKDPEFIFEIVRDYKKQNLKRFQAAWTVLDALSRTDAFKQGTVIVGKLSDELALLETGTNRWPSEFSNVLRSSLEQKQTLMVRETGASLRKQGQTYLRYLNELGVQTKLITAEQLLGNIDRLRRDLQIHTTPKKENFMGGLQPLVLGQDLEYWPFEGEYWEDELGGYVYNVASKCQGHGIKDN